MNLEEGFHNSWKREGVQEALDSGIVISIKEHNSRRLDDAVNIVRRMMKSGFSMDECLEYVGEDLKDSVREQILKDDFSNNAEVCQ